METYMKLQYLDKSILTSAGFSHATFTDNSHRDFPQLLQQNHPVGPLTTQSSMN